MGLVNFLEAHVSRHLLLAVSAFALLAVPLAATEPAKTAAVAVTDQSAALNAFFADYDKAVLER